MLLYFLGSLAYKLKKGKKYITATRRTSVICSALPMIEPFLRISPFFSTLPTMEPLMRTSLLGSTLPMIEPFLRMSPLFSILPTMEPPTRMSPFDSNRPTIEPLMRTSPLDSILPTILQHRRRLSPITLTFTASSKATAMTSLKKLDFFIVLKFLIVIMPQRYLQLNDSDGIGG